MNNITYSEKLSVLKRIIDILSKLFYGNKIVNNKKKITCQASIIVSMAFVAYLVLNVHIIGKNSKSMVRQRNSTKRIYNVY